MAQILLEMKGIMKSFNGSSVLEAVDFSVMQGEVHALMGENGAGKSTLIKILTGIYPKDGGNIYFEGEEVEINNRTDASLLGIKVIYQELSLIPTLTVAQNIMLGREKCKVGVLNKKVMHQEVVELIDKYGFDLNPDAVVETLTIAQRQTVEILKALSEKAKLIIMDEPTASLSSRESEMLFKIIDDLRVQGVSIIYISHRLEEVYRLSDRLTILRDGITRAVLTREEIIPEDVVHCMVGKKLNEATESNNLKVPDTPVVLDVQHLTRHGVFEDVSFKLHKGEILGLAGLVGAGRTEVVRSIFGADIFDNGSVVFENEILSKNIQKNVEKGFGLVPEDRRTQGFVPLLSIEKNVALTNYDTLATKGLVKSFKEKG